VVVVIPGSGRILQTLHRDSYPRGGNAG